MATILTKDMRGKIINATIEHAFKDREARWHRVSSTLGKALYEYHFRHDLKFIEQLSEEWYTLNDELCIRHDAYERTYRCRSNSLIDMETPEGCFKLPKQMRFPQYFDTLLIDSDHEFFDRLAEHARSWTVMHEAARALRDELRTMLYSIRTVEKLLIEWPEGERFVPKIEKRVAQTAVIPHDLTAKINRMLGIAGV